ncbi:MBL fold metallo-hydrolase [Anabaena sp. UHCC 0187]|uniref:MBL fold metallo-hydrolase n=1 Tax=Anabaena sp. UHCC 0187 TaxID=2590018 RepID=UPI00144849F3|nr:MBL fold metallo-hydrolase [Anabaena sp. UHCC 0187]MTJ15065.1 MBL fold metallo-hydrolase [Anabaena sp. UHCC 0187]
MPLKVTFFQAGYCTHPEAIVVQDGRWKTTNFPSLFALISHPQIGAILFDTGYSDRFFQETSSFPFRLYAFTTPVYFQPEDSAVYQLQKAGIEPEAVKYIIISHFHADHIGGLKDFPNAQFICFNSAYQAVKYRRGINALKAGFLSGLLPSDFEQRVIFVEDKQTVSLLPKYAPFTTGFDLLGDGSLIAVELPGHATGQLGLFFIDADHHNYFLIADACWLSRAYQEFIKPHPITNLIFANKQEYVDTLSKIHQLHKLNPELKIIPTHCLKTWQELEKNYL